MPLQPAESRQQSGDDCERRLTQASVSPQMFVLLCGYLVFFMQARNRAVYGGCQGHTRPFFWGRPACTAKGSLAPSAGARGAASASDMPDACERSQLSSLACC